MGNGWIWIARLLNMAPRKITPLILTLFLELCGYDFIQLYRVQAHKIIRFIYNNYTTLMTKDSFQAVSQLKSSIEDYFQKGKSIDSFPGKNLAN